MEDKNKDNTENNLRIGILGGSFNSIHNSHVKLVRCLIEGNYVNEVWVMPCKNHVFEKQLASPEHRANMIELAIQNLERVTLCRFELDQPGDTKNYTIDTLRALRRIYPHRFFIVTGSDVLQSITRWHGFPDLQKEAEYIIFNRETYPIINPGIKIERVIDFKRDNLSSSDIRERVKLGKSLEGRVPREVENYIGKQGLYHQPR
jgi:nicotinate-nucleotide adenylyltransferase